MTTLEDFVSESLQQIVRAVVASQGEAQKHGAQICPAAIVRGTEGTRLFQKNSGALLAEVEFDVAVTATEGKETKGGIGVIAGIVSLGSAGQSQAGTTAASRIRFTIPVLLPEGGATPPPAKRKSMAQLKREADARS